MLRYKGDSEQVWQSNGTPSFVFSKALLGCDVEVGLMKSNTTAGGNYNCPAKEDTYWSYGSNHVDSKIQRFKK